MSHISTEQALQLPKHLQRQDTQNQQSQGNTSEDAQRKILKDDAVTLLMNQSASPIKKVKVENYKGELGQERSFIKETLKNKLAEYKLNPNTRITIQKDMFGNIEIEGGLLPSDIERLNLDLNNNKLFKAAFDKLSQQEPTLNYVDNVVKLSKVYGVQNSLFNSLISEQNEYNKLNDIAHRYEALRNNTNSNEHLMDSSDRTGFNFVLNA